MPNRLQWWRDRLRQKYFIVSAIGVGLALLLAAGASWFWPADAIYYESGIIRLSPVF